MKSVKYANVETAATLANGAQLVAEISARVLSGQVSQSYNDMNLEENQIISLAQAVFQTEILKKIGAQ